MKKNAESILNMLIERYPPLKISKDCIASAFEMLFGSFKNGGKLLLCGNGGSAADCEHIVGELMKEFTIKRPIEVAIGQKIRRSFPENCEHLLSGLQGALPAISLTGQTAISTAYINDAEPDLVFAQQVYGLCREKDVVMAISTSGNSKNVVNAVMTAKAIGAGTVALTGEKKSLLSSVSDVAIRVPASETYLVQELHLPVYHALCAMLEAEFWMR